jgi:hypothetical protein
MLKAYRYKLEPNQSQRYALARRVENPSRRNVGGLRIGLFNPIAEALEFPDHSGRPASL